MGTYLSKEDKTNLIEPVETINMHLIDSKKGLKKEEFKIKNKANFFYIRAIDRSEYFPAEDTIEKRESLLSNLKKEETDQFSLEELLEEESEKMQQRSITVQWNTFVKIKKRNYLEEYKIIKRIGKGTYGEVLKIKMKYGDMYRAAKIIQSNRLTGKGSKEKVFAEIAIPLKLDHPHINKLLEVFDWEQKYVLIMELCERGDLFKYINSERVFEEKRVCAIMKQLLSAVYYLHRQNVVHRDIKPENILVDESNNNIKIIDFGSATYICQGKQLTEIVGTPYYMAPEVNNHLYNEKCDVWSCGVIMYILLCGTPPFNGRNENEILHNVCHQSLDFNSKIWRKRSLESKELLTKMLQKKPNERWSALEAMNHKWITSTETKSGKELYIMEEIEQEVVHNLKSFHFTNRLKAVVYTYIASQLYEDKDKERLLTAFRGIDKNGDGMLNKEELLELFHEYEKKSKSSLDVEKILNIVDTNQSGAIDFTEFLVAASDEKKMLEMSKLENVFQYLDADHSGFITAKEVSAFLDGSSETDDEIKEIFKSVDLNGDGTISKEEFLNLMKHF